jgi:hypothetical protein
MFGHQHLFEACLQQHKGCSCAQCDTSHYHTCRTSVIPLNYLPLKIAGYAISGYTSICVCWLLSYPLPFMEDKFYIIYLPAACVVIRPRPTNISFENHVAYSTKGCSSNQCYSSLQLWPCTSNDSWICNPPLWLDVEFKNLQNVKVWTWKFSMIVNF